MLLNYKPSLNVTPGTVCAISQISIGCEFLQGFVVA